MNKMKLKTTELEHIQGPFEFKIPTKEIELEGIHPVSTDILMRIDVHHSGGNFEIKGVATITLEEICDRCLDNFLDNIEVPFFTLVTRQFSLINDIRDQDIIVLKKNQTEFDLEPIVHDAILLGRSMKHLCKENCKGLCSGCGVNLNIETCTCKKEAFDERWAPLKKLTFS